MLHWHQIWNQMRKLTNKEIEKRAIMEVIDYFEPRIDAVIKQSSIELDKLNKCRKIQNLDPKIRIDKYCIKNAIKTINNNGHSSLSERTGGIIQKVKKNNETHTHENTEVV